MKQKHILTVLFIFLTLLGTAQQKAVSNGILPRPKLVVGIVVDQMRWDYLYRFYERYGNTGFKRMLNEGFSCENTYINYLPTVTAIGHTTVYTGSVPAIHGITGNDYIVKKTGKKQNSTGDTTVRTVGSSSKAGWISPRNLLTSTITDELRLATNFRSKVISISMKDRGAVFPGGHTANAAYWFDDLTGNWITSTYYAPDLPIWVKAFNDRKLAALYLKQDWKTLYATNTYLQSSPDDSPYEGKFAEADKPTFPVLTSGMFQKNFSILRTTPYGNSLTLEMAKASLTNEKLGKRGVTDFLAISFSATDAIGHQFGVNSMEVEDTYLRLDKELGSFFSYLDKEVGKGQYTVFLTADHGASQNTAFLGANKLVAGRWAGPVYEKELNRILQEKFKVPALVISFLNYQVNLDHPLIKSNNLDLEAIKRECITYLQQQPGVFQVIDMESTGKTPLVEPLKSRMVNGYHKDRCGDLQIILHPSWISGYSTGSGHSVWNPYDSHIPLVWMGWGISKGQTNEPVNMTDIAPTLAALLRIQEPNGNVGKPIPAVFQKKAAQP